MNYHRYQFPATGTLHRSDDDAVDLYNWKAVWMRAA